MPEGITYPELETKEKLDVLIVDGGMRGEALKWKFEQSERAREVHKTTFDRNKPISEVARVGRMAIELGIDFALVGQDDALNAGVVDHLRARRIPTCGSTAQDARLEASKAWMKQLCRELGLPTAHHNTFTHERRRAAHDFVDTLGSRMVVKDDFLARGQGVKVCHSNSEAHTAVDDMFDRKFNNLGELILVEEFSEGRERSGHASISGPQRAIWPAAEDYKQLLDGDKGPMTGGFGSITPVPGLNPEGAFEQDDYTISKLQSKILDHEGFWYPGYKGVDLLEVNVRTGSTETEAYVRNMLSDFLEHCIAIVNGNLSNHPIEWQSGYAISLVGASEGYPDPDKVKQGQLITGLEQAREVESTEIFLGGAAVEDGKIYTTGVSRNLVVSVRGDSPDETLERGLEAMSLIRIGGKPPLHRTDIGKRAA